MLIAKLLAAGGLLFAFDHATSAGKFVLSLLAVASIFSWSIMITKLRVIRFARKQNARFLAVFRQDRQPLRLFEKNARFPGSPVFNVYRAGCEEMTFHLLGSPEVDDTFRNFSTRRSGESVNGLVADSVIPVVPTGDLVTTVPVTSTRSPTCGAISASAESSRR